MRKSKQTPALALALAMALATTTPPARATGIPVIDVAALVQLMQQIAYWRRQIQGMAAQINELRETKNAMTGQRGYETLLPQTDATRNYLPPDYGDTTGYPQLAQQIQLALQANAVLNTTQLGHLSPQERQLVEDGRQAAATISTLSKAAYRNTSQRFAQLQALVQAIGTAGDPKAIAELQARIQSEQTMLTNDQTKLQTLYDIAQAEEIAYRQRVRERVIADHGGFASRFEPQPKE